MQAPELAQFSLVPVDAGLVADCAELLRRCYCLRLEVSCILQHHAFLAMHVGDQAAPLVRPTPHHGQVSQVGPAMPILQWCE